MNIIANKRLMTPNDTTKLSACITSSGRNPAKYLPRAERAVVMSMEISRRKASDSTQREHIAARMRVDDDTRVPPSSRMAPYGARILGLVAVSD